MKSATNKLKMIVLGDGRWTADGCVTITVYLHKPSLSEGWNKTCYVIITVDCPSLSMIDPNNEIINMHEGHSCRT